MPRRGRETLRLEAFSDGVIAIAITLLVLEIRVPHIEEATPDALWRALRGLWPSYLGYLISFATIGIMWANHHTIFRLIDRTDHYLVLANLLFLFFVAAIPFPTALMADYLGHPAEQVGVIVYGGWFLLTAAPPTTCSGSRRGREPPNRPGGESSRRPRGLVALPHRPAGLRVGVCARVLQPGGESGRAPRSGAGLRPAVWEDHRVNRQWHHDESV